MKTNQKTMYLSIAALVLAVIGISVAYAALSTTLRITFANVNQTALNWNVGFETGTVNGSATGTSVTGLTCGAATVTSDTVSLANTTLSKPGDTCTYSLTIKNTGDIDANLATITPKTPDATTCTTNGASMVCGNLTYKLTTDQAGTTVLTNNRTLTATSGTLPVYLIVTYSGTAVNTSDVTQTAGGFTLVYEQA